MSIDRSERTVIVITILTLGLFVFSLLYAKGKYKSNVVECVPFDKTFTESKVTKLDSKTWQVFVVASMWQFQPSEITVPAGTKVDFYLTSKDVVHGFNIAQKNVNMMAINGTINKTTVVFDKPGVYDIVCHEYCGVAHQNMRAQVMVNYPEAQ